MADEAQLIIDELDWSDFIRRFFGPMYLALVEPGDRPVAYPCYAKIISVGVASVSGEPIKSGIIVFFYPDEARLLLGYSNKKDILEGYNYAEAEQEGNS